MKRIAVILSALMLFIAVLSVPAYADSATIALSKSSVTVGSNVTVTIRYNASYGMYAIDGTLTYNSSVLQYVSGGTNSGSTVKIVEALSGEKSKSASIVFKAIAAGAGSLSFSGKASGEGDGSASAGATVNVTATQPSKNANLASINLSDGQLSPAFKAGTTSYSASVKYTTEKISISANAAVGDSTVAGLGTFDLKVGDNSFALTVTAASGAKKTYTIKIKRMTEEETAAAIEDERKNNPHLIVVDGADYFLSEDLSNIGNIAGYTLSSVERKGANIGVFTDNNGKYTLYWATDENGENGAFYTSDEQDNFTRLNYIKIGEKLYIIEPFDSGINVSSQFVADKYDMGGISIDCYKYSDESLSDFYLFNCYIDGKNDYYMFDSLENTIQREPTFILAEQAVSNNTSANLWDKFNALNLQAKIVLILLSVAALLVFVLIVLLIIRAAKVDTVVGSARDEAAADSFADFGNVISDDDLIFDTTENDDGVVIGQTELFSVPGNDNEIDGPENIEFLDTNDNNE